MMFSAPALLISVTGCATCPATMPVTLGDSTTVTASADTGPANLKNSTWTFYANTLVAPLTIFGDVLPIDTGMLFRTDFGGQGQLTRVFDNVRLAPETLGRELIIDNAVHPAAMPPLSYAAVSFGAQNGSAVALSTCGILYVGPLEIIHATVEFSGTENDLLGRADGKLKFTTQVNPLFATFIAAVQSGTVELDGFALKEGSSIPIVQVNPGLLP